MRKHAIWQALRQCDPALWTKLGSLSRMDALQAQQMAQETQRRRHQKLLEIEAALRRLYLEDYGYCLVCGEEISLGRPGIDPAATRCIGSADG